MIFSRNINEAESQDEVDALVNKDPDTTEGTDNIAKEVEDAMQTAAMEAVSYFDGGEEAQKHFIESAEVNALLEARRMSKKTIVRIGSVDDLKRRTNLASLIMAREKNDPLYKKYAFNRMQERKIRQQIYKKYGAKATRIAKVSQKKHIANMRKLPALPTIKFN